MDSKILENAFDIMSLELCDVLAVNDIREKWILLVLKGLKIANFSDLTPENSVKLINEIRVCEKALLSLNKRHVSMISMKLESDGKFIVSIRLKNLRFIGALISYDGYLHSYSDMKNIAGAIKNKIVALQDEMINCSL